MSDDGKYFVQNCQSEQAHQKSKPQEHLIEEEVPSWLWQYVLSDLFQCNDQMFLLISEAYLGFLILHSYDKKTVLQ